MLQQTGVSTVIPYYERFFSAFPDIFALATASEDAVMQLWQGLGYYRRAKNMRLAAQLIVEKFGGKFPQMRDELLTVPGIGEYTAGAILSIAYRKPHPALDGNLIRVYARYHLIAQNVNEGPTLKNLWRIAAEHTPREGKHSREFTEGMMELGARICVPRNPLCLICPLRKGCAAFATGLTEELPRRAKARAREKYFEEVFVVEKNRRWAFLPRGSDPKFPDFLRLPYRKLEAAMSSPAKYDIQMKYSVTHRDFTVFVQRASKPPEQSTDLKWLKETEIKAALLPAIDRKILAELAAVV